MPEGYQPLVLKAKEMLSFLELTLKPFLGGKILSQERQTILVLLQNNMELRPTGGFIGSYALLNFFQGKLVDFEVYDVYEADGQLRGHAEPPADLKQYLGEDGWYLRDANWSPLFPKPRFRRLGFLEKEMGKKWTGFGQLTEVAKKSA